MIFALYKFDFGYRVISVAFFIHGLQQVVINLLQR